MQRALIVIAMLALVIASIAAGTLAAHWPFWQRAWQWHSAPQGWPAQLDGPTLTLLPATMPMPLAITVDPMLAALSRGSGTSLLLLSAGDGSARAYFAQGASEQTLVDGRELGNALLVLLYGALIQQGHAHLLDEPIGNVIAQWHDDPRGAITPRQLLWQLSGLAGGPYSPLNPFSPMAQLASGPDFQRAALATPLRFPPGSHYMVSPANAQLLALVATRVTGESYAAALQRNLWSRLAAQPATAMLDHRRGEIAAHCCFTASAGDWLRVGLVLANGGRVQDQQILAADFVQQVATSSPVNPGQGLGFQVLAGTAGHRLLQLATTGRRLIVEPDSHRALLWVGTGEPPDGLGDLLLQGQ